MSVNSDAVNIYTLAIAEVVQVTSLNYPGRYPYNFRKLWELTVPTDYVVLLEFTDFKLGSCCDNLRVYSGSEPSFTKRRLLTQLTGSRVPIDVVSDGSYLWLDFLTDSYGTHRGFSLYASALNITGKGHFWWHFSFAAIQSPFHTGIIQNHIIMSNAFIQRNITSSWNIHKEF